MSFRIWILSILVLYLDGSTVLGSPCSKENRTQDLPNCLAKIKEGLLDPSKFWFGSDYSTRCPPDDDSVFCINPSRSETSIQVRLFTNLELTGGIDRFLELNFESGGKNYEACGNTFNTTETWRYDADPTSDTVVYPWYVKNFPIAVDWNYTAGEYYTLMIYDAGYLVSRGLYVNIPQDDITSAEVIQHYGGPLLARDIKNPFVFLLFKQSGLLTVPDGWKEKVTTGNTAGAWIIEDFSTDLNMTGIVAINWITITGDEWSAQTMMDKGGPYAMCPLFATKALHRKQRPFIPRDAQMSVWIDFDFMPAIDRTVTVCCKQTTYRGRNFTVNALGDQNYSTWEVRTESPHKVTLTKLGYYSQRKNFTGDVYTVISVDPDVPIPSAGSQERPILHGLVANIMDGDLKSGDFGLHWKGPFPPNDVPHYYYTLLYKQQSEVNATDMVTNYAGTECVERLIDRCLYDINRAVRDNNLTLVGATWFTAQRDLYVRERQLNVTGSVEAEVCAGQPGYSEPCTTDSAIVVFPSTVFISIILLSFLLL